MTCKVCGNNGSVHWLGCTEGTRPPPVTLCQTCSDPITDLAACCTVTVDGSPFEVHTTCCDQCNHPTGQ